ncbi:MAG: vWA domain-containing protein [Sporichthyaceae bacterium]
MSSPDAGDQLVAVLSGFCRELRGAGVAGGTHDLIAFADTMSGPLDPTDIVDLYWGGRTTLVHRREDIETYHRVFRQYFLTKGNPVAQIVKIRAHADAPREESVVTFDIPETDPRADNDDEEEATRLGLMASNVATLKSKSFGECTSNEEEALRRIMRRMRLRPPTRTTRRTKPGPGRGKPDLRRTMSAAMRTQGELLELRRRVRRTRARPVILILDISGSMADHSRSLLQFAWSARRAADRVEVFAFGTRLSHLTKALNTRSLDIAMTRAGAEVFDWEGGTRIGAAVEEFVKRWGRRGMARGAIVVICSDGFDRGDPETLHKGMEKLARLAHTVVWLHPARPSGATDWVPQSLGMAVAAPFCDAVLSCRDLAALEEFAKALPGFASGNKWRSASRGVHR